ncbi:ABC transporter permease [Bacteroides eggerthii]|jgi:ABC-2 type transport system permease protein|uniref:ABC transporter permease n=1 Tax=Bacteroides eggerthii TaxID=28111 RepID=UPI00189F981D|nr:ABC transporter permease [Bacteroides eggerthii]
MIKYLIEKEFKQMLRNSFLPKLIFIFPCMIMILMPWAANLEIKNINLNIVDNDHSVVSRRLVDKIGASTYFRLTALPATYDESLLGIEAGIADVILEIPYDFEKDWINGKAPRLLVAANAVNGTKGSLGGSYLSSIISDYSRELMSEVPVKALTGKPLPRISVSTLNLYNPTLNYKLFMIPALMVMLLTLICGFLPALNVVGEKEAGTIEQINVTPVNKFTFIAAKLIPYWLIGFVVLTICFVLAWLLYGILPAGHFLTIYVFALVFLPVVSGFGLVISNHSATLQQAMFVMWFFMLVLILMSGLFTPIHSMPEWAQWITHINPLRYFVEVMRTIYLRGGGLAELFPQLGALLIFAIVANIWAVRSYRKSS